MGKKSLGRSMATLFHDHALPEPEAAGGNASKVQVRSIAVTEIEPNPFQPRRIFRAEDIEELAATIATHGLISPISVRRHEGRYQIVAGERRFRAVQHLGWTEVDARVIDLLSDKSMMEWAIIENIQRVDLNPIEEASSYQNLIEHHGYTHDQLAIRLGKSRSAITNGLRLLRLPERVRTWVEEGLLSAGHARSLLSPDISDPEKMAQEIMEKGLSVRQAEERQKPNGKNPKPTTAGIVDPNLKNLLDELNYALGTRVKWSEKGQGRGVLQLEVSGTEDLLRIRDIIFQGSSSAQVSP